MSDVAGDGSFAESAARIRKTVEGAVLGQGAAIESLV